MATSAPNRRRQRSVRVTVAVALLALAGLVVLLALPTQSPLWLSFSSVFALVCGATASRIVYSELMQSRREAATDRAVQAQAYRTMFHERAAEHAEFTSAMTDRLAARDRAVQELEGTVVLAETRAIEAETRLKREARRANEAQELVAELQHKLEVSNAELEARNAELVARGAELEARAAELAETRQQQRQERPAESDTERGEELAAWGGWDGALDAETVVDLLAWEEKAAQAGSADPASTRRHA